MAIDAKYRGIVFVADEDLIDLIPKWNQQDDGVVHTTGDQTISGVKTFTDVMTGIALKTKWADLAEVYETDAQYPIGTLVQFGGPKEMTIATTEVNGVVSDKPAYLMNSSGKGQPIALAGRVKIRVSGVVSKFDRLVLDHTGLARVDNEAPNHLVIGRALENSFNGTVLCCTKFRL